MSDKIRINLEIGQKHYPLTINREDEEKVRKAAHRVNIRLNAYRSHYTELTMDNIMPMVAYQFSLELLEAETKNDTGPYINKIEELNTLLEDNL